MAEFLKAHWFEIVAFVDKIYAAIKAYFTDAE
jgi:hypothetical protein